MEYSISVGDNFVGVDTEETRYTFTYKYSTRIFKHKQDFTMQRLLMLPKILSTLNES
jgi:hypothetical protein